MREMFLRLRTITNAPARALAKSKTGITIAATSPGLAPLPCRSASNSGELDEGADMAADAVDTRDEGNIGDVPDTKGGCPDEFGVFWWDDGSVGVLSWADSLASGESSTVYST